MHNVVIVTLLPSCYFTTSSGCYLGIVYGTWLTSVIWTYILLYCWLVVVNLVISFCAVCPRSIVQSSIDVWRNTRQNFLCFSLIYSFYLLFFLELRSNRTERMRHCTIMKAALHCAALHCTALHCTALHCTALVLSKHSYTHTPTVPTHRLLLANLISRELATSC